MNSHDYLPQGDKDFLAWVVNFLKHLFPSLTRFGFPNDVYQALAGQRNDFEQKLAAIMNFKIPKFQYLNCEIFKFL
jgi:hypothetical protein